MDNRKCSMVARQRRKLFVDVRNKCNGRRNDKPVMGSGHVREQHQIQEDNVLSRRNTQVAAGEIIYHERGSTHTSTSTRFTAAYVSRTVSRTG